MVAHVVSCLRTSVRRATVVPSAVLAAALALPLAAQAPAPLDLPALLQRLTDVSWIHRPPQPGERTVQWSSYDRRSDKGPGNADDWYGNDDRGQYLRTEQRSGHDEYVLCDTDGPGAIARLWSANPHGTIHFDIDGARVWSVDLGELCSGKVAPIVEPLAGMHSKGGNCYLPIAFGKHLKVSATANDLYYHVDVWSPPAGTGVVSFQPRQLQQCEHAIAAACAELSAGPPVLRPLSVSAAAGDAPAPRTQLPKGTVVTTVGVRWDQPPPGDPGQELREVLLVVRCGDEETVRVPVLDFFGCGPDWRTHCGVQLGGGPQQGWCRWPMPMPQGGEVYLERRGGGWLPQLAVAAIPATARADDLLFRASFHLEKGFPSRPFRDFTVLDASGGPGRFVGTALIVKNPHRAWWGEGDEKFTVDGEGFPSWFGTGTEDYFGYAWCCPEPFSAAFHAQPQCDGPGNYGFTAVNRMHVLDSVPFQRTFRFDLEVWHWVPKLAIDYASVAYWYAPAGATSGLPALPDAAARTLDRLPPVVVLHVPQALEGEALKITKCTGGKHETQDVSFVAGAFSGDQHCWWIDGKPGDVLELAVPVANAGRYRVRAAFVRARDYGIVQCRLGDQDLGAPIDLYAPDVSASGPLDLGEVQLAAGSATLQLRIVGHADKAEPRHMVGLDYLLLEPVR